MQIIVTVILIAAAAIFFLYILRQMLAAPPCPKCQREEGTEEMLIPILPPAVWICINCGTSFRGSELRGERSERE